MKSTDLISVFCRPVPFWSWNDKLEPDELRRQIGAMQDAGMGGFFMHARGGLETEYLSEDWFRAVEASVDEAKKRGMQAWCYDENGWPSGFAGGKLLENPENWAHYLRFERKTDFDAAALGVYTLENGHIRRITGAANGISEYLCVYDCQNSSTVDILDPRITDAFLALTHEKYFERFGAEFGKGIAGFFTDEPQYFRYETAYTPVLLTEYNGKEEKIFEDILDFHVKFERIHPFQDGSGRVGRLIMFKECLKYNIVPFIIEDNLKMFYYRGLKEWNNEKGYLTDTCLIAQDKYKTYLDYFRIMY